MKGRVCDEEVGGRRGGVLAALVRVSLARGMSFYQVYLSDFCSSEHHLRRLRCRRGCRDSRRYRRSSPLPAQSNLPGSENGVVKA